MTDLESQLKKYFGFDTFRYPQQKIITRIMEKRDVLAILPTGRGKSLCYQLPAVILPPTTIVISPLIALMKDQVDSLNQKGIRAGLINSSQSLTEQKQVFHLLKSGYFQLVYVSPERLQSPKFRSIATKIHVSLLAVDEAHCISQWGHDFRPEYLQICNFIAQLPHRPPIIALTATASSQTQKEIVTSLNLEQAKLFRTSVYRPNLLLETWKCPSASSKLALLTNLLNQNRNNMVLVYCATRKSVIQLFNFFSQFSRFRTQNLAYYHGGLDQPTRIQIQDQFTTQNSGVLFATNAFGMGIDRSDIRLIIHYHLPANFEAYAQEIGRAGRDGQSSQVSLLFSQADCQIHTGMIKSTTSQQLQQYQLDQLELMRNYALSKVCRNVIMRQYFGEDGSQNCENCDNCLNSGPTYLSTHHPLVNRQLVNNLDRLRSTLRDLSQQSPLPPITQSSLLWWGLLLPTNQMELACVPGIGEGWLAQLTTSQINQLIQLGVTKT